MNKILKLSVIILIFLNWASFVQGAFLADDWAKDLVYQNTEIPKILPRSTWENDQTLKNLMTWYPSSELPTASAPEYSNIERIIIHDMGCDTDNSGCNDQKRDPIELIQGIYRYHTITKGWGDIGYHYIIDYWGNIYEGRYGGNGVRGAHTYYEKKCDNFNVGTVGILLMGNYEKTRLPETMYKSLARLVAWIVYTNSLDPTDLSHYSEIWSAPKVDKECDTSKAGLLSSYTGPVVVGHKDVENSNPDPGIVDLKRVRQEANQIILTYKNYLFANKADSKIYTIKNGKLQEFIGDNSDYTIISLVQNQINSFLGASLNKVADGALVKSYTRDRVYLIQDNKRRPILSQRLFNLKKYKWSSVISLSDRDLAVYPLSTPLSYPNGTLIKGFGPEVYLIENEKRRLITSMALFNNRGYKWKDVITISDEELLGHPVGEIVLFKDGTLIKGPSPEIYLVKNQKKNWIKSIDVFLKLGFNWKNVVKISSQEVNQYALGMAIGSLDDFKNLGKEEIIQEKETSKELIIRVGIYTIDSGKTFRIRANGPYEIYKNNEFFGLKNKDEIFETKLDTQNSFKFIPKTDNTVFELIDYEDQPEWNLDLNDNLFRGNMEIKYSAVSKKIWMVNELNLENYLKGLAEALDEHSTEYLKSLIIAARSYAIFHVENDGKYPGEVFHIRNWANDQLYKGYGFEKRAPNIAKAVEATKGIVISYNNKTVRGLYSSDSGGVTKDACKIWGGIFCNADYNYLRGGIKDPTGTEHTQAAILASHGVGISAVGARVLANQGKTYEEILKYYYPGIEIKKLY
jgi:peptidoglycan hydrolase-like amidase